MKKIIVMGLARNGHHAIINWMCRQLEGRTVFKNNVNEKLQPRAVLNYGRGKTQNQVCSFENFDLVGFKKLFKPGDFDQIILVVRDPYNWIASSLKKRVGYNEKLALLTKPFKQGGDGLRYSRYFGESKGRLDMFYQYMEQVLKEKDYLGQDFITVNFNKWFVSKPYRKKIAHEIGFPFTDKGVNQVLAFGGGSSFDRHNFAGRASQMKVLERWKQMKANPRFQELIKDPRIEDYSVRYFNFKP